MARWYRAYEGTVSDPKLGEAALIAETSRSVAVAAWHAILESAAATNEAGRFDTSARRLAAALGEPVALMAKVMEAFDEIGLTRDGYVAAWSARQFESDTSTERSRKHRQRSRNVAPTLRDGDASPPETDTEEDTSPSEAKASPGEDAPSASRPPDCLPLEAPAYTDDVHELFGEGVGILVSMGVREKQARSCIGRWRRDADEDCRAVLDAIQRARDQRVADPIPWVTQALRTRGSRAPPRVQNGFLAVVQHLEGEHGNGYYSSDQGVGTGADISGAVSFAGVASQRPRRL